MRRAPVTVIIPARNRAALLAETLRSVAGQTVAPEAVIVCDDASEEDIVGLAEGSGAECIRNDGPRWGASRARNAALERVTTPLVWFLDSDDLLLPNGIELLTDALGDSDAPFATGVSVIAEHRKRGWRLEGEISTFPDEELDPYRSLRIRNWVPTSCAVSRTEVVREVGGFDAGLSFSEDHALWLSLTRKGSPVYVDEIVGVHRIGGRHDAGAALSDDLKIKEQATQNEQSPGVGAARDGVLLWSGISESLHGRRPGRAAWFLWTFLLRRPNRLGTAAGAIGFIRRRRALRRKFKARVRRNPALIDWLEGYS